MSDLNQLNVSGRLTKDALVKHTRGGNTVTELHLAINEEDGPIFLQVDCWGDEASEIAGDLEKGQRLMISGRLRQILTGQGTREAKRRLVMVSSYIVVAEDF
jgi:single-stranded DNA-binding protein